MNILEEAIIYSTTLFQGKVRKIKGNPLILHSLEVAQILSTMTDDQEVLAAGVLHDVADDTEGTLSEIRERFGDRVADLIAVGTGTKMHLDEEMPADWKSRKQESFSKLKKSRDIGANMLWLADKLSDLRLLKGVYSEHGEKIWSILNVKDLELIRWYFRTVAESVEMDLNRTGAYKEFIQHINFIWPGTFDSRKERYRKRREVSIEGDELIGKGAKGKIYRHSDELIVKVYNDSITYSDVERETALARKAFVMGLPTAISFGIVSVGQRYGAMFELLNAKTVSEWIIQNPGFVDHYAKVMANLAREFHRVEAKSEDEFPNAIDTMLEWVNRGLRGEAALEKEGEKLRDMICAIPRTLHMVHGDYHTGNVLLQNGEPLVIDLERMSIGPAIMDLGNFYLFYRAYGELNPDIIENYMGFSSSIARTLCDRFFIYYFKTDDESRIREIEEKVSLLAYVRILGQIKKNSEPSEEEIREMEYLRGKIKELLKKTDDFLID